MTAGSFAVLTLRRGDINAATNQILELGVVLTGKDDLPALGIEVASGDFEASLLKVEEFAAGHRIVLFNGPLGGEGTLETRESVAVEEQHPELDARLVVRHQDLLEG